MNLHGLTARPLTMDDAHAYARAATDIAHSAGTNEQIQADDTGLLWSEPNFDLERSSLGIFTSGGRLAAYIILWATSEVPVHPWVNWGIHPDFHDHDLSAQLFDWADRHAAEIMQRCPPHAKFSLHAETPADYAFAETALEQAGYQPIRASYVMRISMKQRPIIPPLPPGLTLKPYQHPSDLPAFVDAVRDSFSDHFGYVEQPYQKDIDMFRHWFDNDKNFDPQLIILAQDKQANLIAGCLFALKEDYGHPGIGYIDILGVRRSYRRQGLAQAMLYRSFAAYWDRGIHTVGLGVDGQSLTNAVALYEKVGMRIHKKYMTREKILRNGIELAKTSID